MARTRRLIVPGGIYHVASRGNNKQVIFDDELRRLHIRNLGEIAARIRVVGRRLGRSLEPLPPRPQDRRRRPVGRDAEAEPPARPSFERAVRPDQPLRWTALLERADRHPGVLRGQHPLHALEPGAGGHRATSGRHELVELPRARSGSTGNQGRSTRTELLRYFGRTPTAAVESFKRWVSTGREHALRRWDDRDGRPQVSVYSGPEPPSGGVRRPPLAVIAPHWTQFDGLTSSSTRPSSPDRARPRRPAPGTCSPRARRARPAPGSRHGCGSAGRPASGCPRGRPTTACRT